MSQPEIIDRVYDVILERRRERPAGSYVVTLLEGGPDAIAAKVREEAEELIEAAASADLAQVAHEAADLLFHTLVLLGSVDVAPTRAYEVLEKRFGTGGLVEKATRERPDAE
jgi:phosphoribosyl-ATP pyrophosphohydrolase